MPAEPANPKRPPHPLPQLTTYELRDYRRELEHAIGRNPGAAALAGLRRRLEQVIAEQDDRARAAKAAAHA